MKVQEGVLGKRPGGIVIVIKIPFDYMPGNGTIDAMSIFVYLQEEYRSKGKKLDVFCGPGESLLLNTRNVLEIVMRRKQILEFWLSSDEF